MNKCTLCSEGQYLHKHIVFSSRRDDRLVVIEGNYIRECPKGDKRPINTIFTTLGPSLF